MSRTESQKLEELNDLYKELMDDEIMKLKYIEQLIRDLYELVTDRIRG